MKRNWKHFREEKKVIMKKSIFVVFFVMMLVMSSQVCFVHGRNLGAKKVRKDEVTSFVSSNKSNDGASNRNVGILSSGPSKNGKGH